MEKCVPVRLHCRDLDPFGVVQGHEQIHKQRLGKGAPGPILLAKGLYDNNGGTQPHTIRMEVTFPQSFPKL